MTTPDPFDDDILDLSSFEETEKKEKPADLASLEQDPMGTDFGADLDALLDSLGADTSLTSPAQPLPVKAAAPAPVAAPIANPTPVGHVVDPDETLPEIGTSDIDSLLAELGVQAPAAKTLSSPAAQEEEEDILLLDPVTSALPQQAPAPAAIPAPASAEPGTARSSAKSGGSDSIDLNELDALLDDMLSTAPASRHIDAQPQQTPSGNTAAPLAAPAPAAPAMPVAPAAPGVDPSFERRLNALEAALAGMHAQTEQETAQEDALSTQIERADSLEERLGALEAAFSALRDKVQATNELMTQTNEAMTQAREEAKTEGDERDQAWTLAQENAATELETVKHAQESMSETLQSLQEAHQSLSSSLAEALHSAQESAAAELDEVKTVQQLIRETLNGVAKAQQSLAEAVAQAQQEFSAVMADSQQAQASPPATVNESALAEALLQADSPLANRLISAVCASLLGKAPAEDSQESFAALFKREMEQFTAAAAARVIREEIAALSQLSEENSD